MGIVKDFATRREITIDEAINAFIQSHKPGTVERFNQILAELDRFMASRGKRWQDCDTAEATIFTNYLLSRPDNRKKDNKGRLPSRAYIKQRVGFLRTIWKEMMCYGQKAINPWDNAIKLFRSDKAGGRQRSEELTTTQVRALLSIPDRRTKSGKRDYAFLCAGFGGGLRASEILGLRVMDVRTINSITALDMGETKAGEPQLQTLSAWAADGINELLEQRLEEGGQPDEPLLVNYYDNDTIVDSAHPISYQTFRWRIKKWAIRAKINRRISSHFMRCTSINQVLRLKNGDYDEAMKFSRHASLRSIQEYKRRMIKENPGVLIDYSQPAQPVPTHDSFK